MASFLDSLLAPADLRKLTLAELTTWLGEAGMAKQFWPERLEIVAELPKTPSGQTQKYQLREKFA